MKRFVPLFLVAVISLGGLTACSGSSTGNTTNATTDAGNDVAESTGSGISTGLGIETGIGSSKSATSEADGTAQVDSIIAAVTLDSAGKITKCTIDAAQTRVAFDSTGKITSDKSGEIQTKAEKGEGYGMKNASAIGKEWYEQAEAFAEWTIGKTVAEVEGMKTSKKDDAHPAVPDEPDLSASVSINVGEFLEAVNKAASNAKQASADGNYKTGLGVVTGIGSSKDATDEADGTAQVDSIIAAVTLDGSGKIVACSLDSAQTRVSFNAGGELTADLSQEIQSKAEKRDGYGMKNASAIEKEWYEQAEAFAEWTIGKTVAEVEGMKTKEKDENHPSVPDEPDLAASVSIDVGEFLEAIAKAAANAK